MLKAFGKIGRAMKAGKISANTMMLLMRNYGIQADKSKLDDFVFRHVEMNPNAHDLAILYVANQVVIFMDRSNPEHKRKAEKFVRVAKQANLVGATTDSFTIEELCTVVESYLGLDTSTIDAKPL